MARPRVIDQDAVLDATEAVVGRDGIANMTLDAVAAEAGISKASVIYDYGSKQNLIKAVIERALRTEIDKIRVAVEAYGDGPNSEMHGRIRALAKSKSDRPRAVALNMCSALAQDGELISHMQSFVRQQIDAVLHNAENPRTAMIAFLAVQGLAMLECFGFFDWTEEGRSAILADIAALVDGGEKSSTVS